MRGSLPAAAGDAESAAYANKPVFAFETSWEATPGKLTAEQVRTGARKTAAAVEGGAKRTFSCPDAQDWVLHLRRES